jgi:nuclear pore complex protein Nup54
MLSQPQSTDLTALQAQQQLNHGMLTMVNAVRSPAIFDDDRDQVVTRFNVLQACSGVGKGIARVEGYNDLQSVDFTPENPFCKFKTLCYNRLPSSRNEDGMVTLQFNKPDSVLMSQQETLVKELQTIVSAATVQVVVNTIRPLPDNCSELTLYMTEKSFMGTRRLLAADVYVFLNNRKANLEKLGVTGLYPKTGFTEGNLKLYLQNPPSGITAQMWEESKSTNPDSQKYIPVAILGSKDLLKRAKHQQQETKQHQSRLEIISAEVADLQSHRAVMNAKMEEQRRKLIDLGHRVLRVMAAQEVVRKSGHSVQPQEEQLRIRLESMQAQLDAPLQFKGRLNELMSQIRMHTQIPGSAGSEGSYAVDPPLMGDIQQHLEQQQGALSQLVKVIKEDLDDLKCIEESFAHA